MGLEINLEFVEDVLEKIKNKQLKAETYKRYPKLWDKISETYVGILSMRGVGTFQWTRSIFIEENYKGKNYTTVCEQAEIINDLLESPSIDSDDEKEAFRFITSPCTSEFVKSENEILIKQGENKEFPLLKTSVGVVEAKQFSLVISDKRFKTICYEEPDRGMHPQMIERMKEVLLQKCKGKTVIIVTHSPAFINSISIKNTFVFFRKNNSENCAFGLTSLVSERIRPKVSQICEDEDLKKLLFSSRILLVEGKSDKIVVDAILNHISANQASKRKTHQILSHQIIQLRGSKNALDVHDVCKEIHLPCSILRDRDERVDVYGDLIEGVKELQGFGEFKEKPIGEFMADEKGFKKLCEDLEERDEFIWKHGDLEDFLLSEKLHRPEILRILEVNEKENSRRKDIKSAIKGKLKKGLSQEKSEKLGNILIKFNETDRLLNFLER